MDSDDDRYLNLILTPLHVCAHYRPKFGQGTKGERIEPASHDFGREVGDNFCPYCEFTFENPLPRSRKCPSCRKDIVRTSTLDQRKVLLTKSEAAEYEIFANNEKIRIASKPKGLTLTQFQTLYQGDAFYNWFGLDNSLMYAAHKAGGGMTSVYRQIGIGCEALFRTILQDTLGLSRQDVRWSYQVPAPRGGMRTLTLDGRVPLEAVQDATARQRFHDWMRKAADGLGVAEQIFNTLTGTIFEVRQGYKSKDSKRQNADIANAATAYTSAYLPCAVILSTQIDGDLLLRYRVERWTVLTGILGADDPLISTYDFMKDVIGYDMAAFFQRNSETLRAELDKVLQALLAPETT